MTGPAASPHSDSRVDASSTELPGWRAKLHEVIFEADTPAGNAFDVVLIALIMVSVAVVMAESVTSIRLQYGPQLRTAEWVITILFTVEYVLRLICVGRPLAYATSFYGIVDLLAILPTYISVIFPGTQALAVVRALRLVRVFRVLKLAQYVHATSTLSQALRASSRKIAVFLFVVLTLVVIIGALMYMIEGGQNGFTSIPAAVYWAIVTMTTVGYGDIAPVTLFGKVLASFVMIIGYGIIAVPTGIVTTELVKGGTKPVSTQACPRCSAEGHEADATYCKDCGSHL